MLSTGYPQLWSYLITGAALFITLCVALYSLHVARHLRTEFPTKTLLNALRGEVSNLSGELADLRDRFSRFQKREGMRSAREEKVADLSIIEQAQAIAAEAAPEEPGDAKMQLRRKARRH
jgi:TolA-binding protein